MSAFNLDFLHRLTNRDIFGAVVREAFLKHLYERTRKECMGCLMSHFFPSKPLFDDHVCNGGEGVYWGLENFAEEEWVKTMNDFPELESQYKEILSQTPYVRRIDRRIKFCCFQPWMVDYVCPSLY